MKKESTKVMSRWVCLLLFLGISVHLHAGPDAKSDRQLSEILSEISEKYQVIITYDAATLEGIRVDIKASELPDNFEAAIKMVMKQTNLNYKNLGTKYYVIYQDTQKGKRDIRKLKRKIKQIQKIESSGQISLGRKHHGAKSQALNMLESIEYLIQGIDISGTVVDEEGNPLIGVNILVKGSYQGTATDLDGNFILEEVDENAVLVVSYVGYQTKEVPIEGESTIVITLVEDSQTLEEVVVVGYGVQRKSDITGSINSVDLENSPVSLAPNMNVLESLKGNVTGLNIGASNAAGQSPSILVRGENSINGSNSPLIVLDGVIYMGDLNTINPNDIASIDVLKDAVSAAAYGSRASNGVIAITTKKGRSDKPIITFNTRAGVKTWPNRPELMKGEEWIDVVNDRNGFAEGSTEWMQAGELANYEAGNETDWLDEISQQGLFQNYQLAVSGASESVNYYLSSSYNEDESVIKGDDFNRVSILGKVDADINNWMNVGINGAYNREDFSGYSASLSSAYKMSPYGVNFRDDEGNLEKYPYTQSLTHPLWGVYDGTRDHQTIQHNYRLQSYASIDIPRIEGLNFRMNVQLTSDRSDGGNFFYEDYYVAEGEGADRYFPSTIQGFLARANGSAYNNTSFSYVWDNILNYNRTFANHNIDATLVATRDSRKYMVEHMTGSDFSTNGNTELGMNGLHFANVQMIDFSGGKKWTNIGYLARLNYSFGGKYYLTTSLRRDGASVFGADNKWGNFGAVGIAWRISEENFMDSYSFMDDLKLKLSWGQNGNQGLDPYTTLSQVANGPSGGLRYQFSNTGSEIYYGLVQSTLGNSTLGWESTETWNTGFSSAWLNNRLFVDLDVYFSQTTDQIFQRNIPVMTGFKTVFASLGQVDNSGLELSLRSINIHKNNFNWSSTVTYWQNNNKLAKLYGEDNDGDGVEDDDIGNSLFIGEPLRPYFGYMQDGIVQEGDDEYIALTGASPGSPKYADLDGEEGITSQDRTILGYRQERFRLNMSNTLTFGNFEFYALITGVFGGSDGYMQSNVNAYLTRTDRFNDNMTSKPYWTPENQSNEYPAPTFSGDGRFLGLQSRSFVRIQDMTIAYSFDQSWVQRMKMNRLQFFVAAKNFATFTNWDGGDPEVGATYLSNTFPVMATFSVGINVSF